MRLLRRRQRATTTPHPPYGSPDFARWLNGPVTRFCGAGFHEVSDKTKTQCHGTISTAGVECPCLCECHAARRTAETC